MWFQVTCSIKNTGYFTRIKLCFCKYIRTKIEDTVIKSWMDNALCEM